MTHPSHQTNGASLEDCHTNFFALVSDSPCWRERVRARARDPAPDSCTSSRQCQRSRIRRRVSARLGSANARRPLENGSEGPPRWPPRRRHLAALHVHVATTRRREDERASERESVRERERERECVCVYDATVVAPRTLTYIRYGDVVAVECLALISFAFVVDVDINVNVVIVARAGVVYRSPSPLPAASACVRMYARTCVRPLVRF